MPVLQQAFDEAAGGDRLLRIPKLELNLSVDRRELEEALPHLILKQIREQLRPYWLQVPDVAEPLQGKSGGTRGFEALLHYLVTGYLPWEDAVAAHGETVAALSTACRERRADLVTFIRQNRPDASFFFRLLQVIEEKDIPLLVSELPESAAREGGVSILEAVELLLDDGSFRLCRQTRLRIAAIVTANCASEPAGALLEKICTTVEGTTVPLQETDAVRGFISLLRGITPRNDLPVKELSSDPVVSKVGPAAGETVPMETAEPWPLAAKSSNGRDQFNGGRRIAAPTSGNPDDRASGGSRRKVNSRTVLGNDPPPDCREDAEGREAGILYMPLPYGATAASGAGSGPVDGDKEDPVAAVGIPEAWREGQEVPPPVAPTPEGVTARISPDLFPLPVAQAGLVLLHPFLPRFFSATGIAASEKGFLPAELARAAALLHFCATGSDEVYEFELALTKVLLGTDPESHLPVCEGLLGQEERDESEALLGAVVSHWSALKNTSTEGFRSAFLQRRGLLRKEDYGWRLNVERRPFDMLLDHLPWSIGIVKLPWMKKPIYVEW